MVAGGLVIEATTPYINKTKMYNSQQTSEKRIQELLSGHPTCFYDNFGMAKHVFIKLKNDLIKHSGLIATRHVSVNEQLAIFLTTL